MQHHVVYRVKRECCSTKDNPYFKNLVIDHNKMDTKQMHCMYKIQFINREIIRFMFLHARFIVVRCVHY